MKYFYSMSTEEVLKDYNTCPEGLSSKAYYHNLSTYGYNELVEKEKKTIITIFLEQFKDFLVVILIISAIISALTGSIESTFVIIAVIILNAILGTIQHLKAEASLNKLKALSAPNAKVIRQGKKIEVPSRELVPGDILLIETGDLIPADGRVLESHSLQVNESSLTGESESVNKYTEIINKEDVPLGDQKNMVFSSSLVTYGRGKILVTKTGMNTELGKIASLMETTKEKKTPLQSSLDDFSKKLSFIILIICFLVFCLSIYRKTPVLDSLLFAVALAVAAIPEALSSIVTIVLALGTQKMANENAIIKNIKAVEGLGCVSIICSDKTGTLTQNKMTTKKIYVDGRLLDSEDLNINNPIENLLLNSSILCNDSTAINGNEIGDPTEVAFVNLGHKYNIDEINLRNSFSRLKEIPFDSDRKLMTTMHQIDNEITILTKGALDVILNRTKYIITSNGINPITEKDKNEILSINEQLSKKGLRVLAFAIKKLNEIKELTTEDEYDYTFLGLISMIDPPREESKLAVKHCINAGIKPIMITGDHKTTATAIAKELGILQKNEISIDGIQLDKMSDKELNDKLDQISVYARVSPKHKIRIVNTWQNRGEIVAMTGDGVNDAPALKQSNIGIAMGITGTEVSKEAASMILTDDNFATIVKAVNNGRNIYNNIKNSIKFLLSGNMSGILSVLYCSIFNLPIPFAAVHLLFINLITDSLPAIAIGLEKETKDVLYDKPRNRSESILTKNYLFSISVQGFIIGIFTMIAFHIGLGIDKSTASTMAFATLCLARLFHGFNCRGKDSIFKLGLFSNIYSILAFIVGITLLNLILFVPVFQNLFEVSYLSYKNILYIYFLAFMPTVFIQICKTIRKNLTM